MAPKSEDEKTMAKRTDDAQNLLDVDILYKQFIGLTNIERVHEEDHVTRMLLQGKSKNEILKNLKAKHPSYTFTYTDIEKFLAKNANIVRAMGKEVTLGAKRHLAAKENCSNMLAGMVLYTQKLVKDFRDEGDNTNTIGAIRALNGTLENYMKLEGMIGNNQEPANVVNVINTISENKDKLKSKIHNANFVYEDNKENN